MSPVQIQFHPCSVQSVSNSSHGIARVMSGHFLQHGVDRRADVVDLSIPSSDGLGSCREDRSGKKKRSQRHEPSDKLAEETGRRKITDKVALEKQEKKEKKRTRDISSEDSMTYYCFAAAADNQERTITRENILLLILQL